MTLILGELAGEHDIWNHFWLDSNLIVDFLNKTEIPIVGRTKFQYDMLEIGTKTNCATTVISFTGIVKNRKWYRAHPAFKTPFSIILRRFDSGTNSQIHYCPLMHEKVSQFFWSRNLVRLTHQMLLGYFKLLRLTIIALSSDWKVQDKWIAVFSRCDLKSSAWDGLIRHSRKFVDLG